MCSRIPQWSWYLRKEQEGEENWGELFRSSVLEESLKDAKKSEPCLEEIVSFDELYIDYAVDYSKGEEWVIFKKDAFFDPKTKKSRITELEQILGKKYPGAWNKDKNGLIRLNPPR